jgi:hypothetical protein
MEGYNKFVIIIIIIINGISARTKGAIAFRDTGTNSKVANG